MTPAQFEQQCRALAAASAGLPGPWVWAEPRPGRAQGYLSQSFEWTLADQRHRRADAAAGCGSDDDAVLLECGSVDGAAEEEDASTLRRGSQGEPRAAAVRTEAHVALSPVYGQPLLLFNLLDAASGALLPHAEVCELLERWLPQPARDGAAPAAPGVTQQEHPVLGLPYYALHGCETAALTAKMGHMEADPGYVVGWLSLLGPLVGVSVPLALATG